MIGDNNIYKLEKVRIKNSYLVILAQITLKVAHTVVNYIYFIHYNIAITKKKIDMEVCNG